MNGIEDFRYKIRGNDIVLLDALIPCFTDLRQGSELFYIVTLAMENNSIDEFCLKARQKSREQKEYFPKQVYELDSLIYFTCIPWFDVTSATNERDSNIDDSIPRLGWGKYYTENEKLILQYSIELNHRLLDGFHAGKFYQKLQEYLNALA